MVRALKLSNQDHGQYYDVWPFRIYVFCVFFSLEVISRNIRQISQFFQFRWTFGKTCLWTIAKYEVSQNISVTGYFRTVTMLNQWTINHTKPSCLFISYSDHTKVNHLNTCPADLIFDQFTEKVILYVCIHNGWI